MAKPVAAVGEHDYVVNALAGKVFDGAPRSGFNGDGHFALETELSHPLAVAALTNYEFVVADASYRSHSRPQAEVIVDTATLIILNGAGLDTSGETIPYVAGWGETGALEAVTEHAELIDRLARSVEDAISGDTRDAAGMAEGLVA